MQHLEFGSPAHLDTISFWNLDNLIQANNQAKTTAFIQICLLF